MKAFYQVITGTAALGLALPASADVIYSNFQNITIPADYDGLYLNVENGAWNTDMANPVAGWGINPFFGGSQLSNSPAFQPVRSGTGSLDAVLNLGQGSTIDSGSVFSTFVQGLGGANPGGPGYGGSQTHLGGGANQFTAGSEGYLGFRLNGNYGWMRVVFTNNTAGAVIKDWAYDNSGAPIAVGNVQQGAAGEPITLNSFGSSFTLGSQITGTNSLIKAGAGTTTLTGANTYSGTTTLSTGTLVINGDQTLATGDVSVSGILAGTGTIGGNTIVNNGGKHSVGNGTAGSVGSATFKGDLSYATGSVFDWDLTAESTTTGFDTVVGSSDKTFTSNAEFRVISDLDFSTNFWDSAREWTTIFSGFSDLTGWSAGTLVNVYNSEGILRDIAVQGSFSITGSELGWAAVPEPSGALAGLLLCAGSLRRRRSS